MNLQKDLLKIWKQLDRAKQLHEVVYCHFTGEPIYDVELGEDTVMQRTVELKAHITAYNYRELSSDVLITDSRCIMRANDLGVAPAIDDTVEYEGNTYRVISTLPNVNTPAIEVQLRSA